MSGTAAQVGSGSGSGGDAADKLVQEGFEQPSDTLLRCRCCSFAEKLQGFLQLCFVSLI